jgi:hypothetical protein
MGATLPQNLVAGITRAVQASILPLLDSQRFGSNAVLDVVELVEVL